MTDSTDYRPTVEEFITLFLAALVLRGRSIIHIRGRNAAEDRRRMHALYAYLNGVCEKADNDSDRVRLHFLLLLRCSMAPGLTGSFDELQNLLRRKIRPVLSTDLPLYEYFQVSMSRIKAQSLLDQANVLMRAFAEVAADVYVADPRREKGDQPVPSAGDQLRKSGRV